MSAWLDDDGPLLGPAAVTEARGPVLASASRVRLQCFPLASDRDGLQRFCDRWFNSRIPPEVAVFRPAMPVVFLGVLHYAEMGDGLLWRTGTLSQNELYFLLLLDRYRLTPSGSLEFVEHSWTTPYIFVDNPTSSVVGRSRYGFPKEVCSFDRAWPGSARPPWAPDATHFLSVSAWEPSAEGHRRVPFLHIVQEPSSRARLDPSGPLVMPRGSVFERGELAWWLRSAFGELRARSSPGPIADYGGWMKEIRRDLRERGPFLNVYNLRQFAHPIRPVAARYLDLVRFRMRVRGTPQDFGFFGERFGPSADFSVVVRRSAIRPIVERLALRVASRQRISDDDDAAPVDVLRSGPPVYVQTDVELASAERVCWKVQDREWKDDAGRPIGGGAGRGWFEYNDHLGPSAAVFLEAQPREPSHDVKYLMLPASADAVDAHLAATIPASCPFRFRVPRAGELTGVRLLVSRSRVPNPDLGDGLVWVDGTYLSLSVPVSYGCPGEPERDGLLLVADFTDNHFLLQSVRELLACETYAGEFAMQREGWFEAPRGARSLVQLRAMTLRRTARAAKHHSLPVLEVLKRRPAGPRREPPLARDWTELRSALWSRLSRIQPLLSFGAIPRPDAPERSVTRRLMLTEITDHDVVAGDAAEDPGHEVRFYASETYPFAARLGLRGRLARGPRRARRPRADIVPVVAFREESLVIRFSVSEILWHEVVPQ